MPTYEKEWFKKLETIMLKKEREGENLKNFNFCSFKNEKSSSLLTNAIKSMS